MSDMLSTETPPETTDTDTPDEAKEEGMEATTEPTAEAKDLKLGQLDPEEAKNLYSWQAEVQQLLKKVGEAEVKISRMETQRDKVVAEKRQMIARMETLEVSAQRFLAEVKQRFKIADGTDWRTLPDGRVEEIDPELIKAAAAARALAQQQAQEAAGTT
jgi:hypothetical protein